MSDDNVVELNQKIELVLFIEGWNIQNGKVFIGASEKIITDQGVEGLKAEDIFADYTTTGVNEEDAKVISLSAVITQEYPGAKYYVVNFKVWDKKGEGEITGNYKFYIKHE